MCETAIKDSLIECNTYKDSIMSTICNILKSEKISYKENTSETEIIIDKEEGKVKKILSDNLSIPKSVMKLLISISESDGATYIRLKFK